MISKDAKLEPSVSLKAITATSLLLIMTRQQNIFLPEKHIRVFYDITKRIMKEKDDMHYWVRDQRAEIGYMVTYFSRLCLLHEDVVARTHERP